jgi:hypothetical protein
MMKNEEKGLVDREANILKMMQEGLGALHEIITRVKESASAQVIKSQSVMGENIKDLAQALNSIKNSVFERLESLEFSLLEEGKYRIEQNSAAVVHIQNIAETIERQGNHTENQIMSTENRLRAMMYEMQQENMQKEEELKR